MVQMKQMHLPHWAARLVRNMLTSTGPTEVKILFMISLATRAVFSGNSGPWNIFSTPRAVYVNIFTEHGQYAFQQVPGLTCSVRLVVVNIDATEIDAAQPPPLYARWAPGPSDDGHSNSSPVHLSQMTHEETLHAGHGVSRAKMQID